MENCESFRGFSLNKMIILFKYCADVKNCESFRGFGFLFKYCVDVGNCESFRGFCFIYIYTSIMPAHCTILVINF